MTISAPFAYGSELDLRITSTDCVTFGAPPVTNPHILHPPGSMFLSFFNEGDPCALAEPNYLKYLIQVWAQPLPSEFDDFTWNNESPKYVPNGTQIALRCERYNLSCTKHETSAFIVDAENRASLLFGNPFTHSMTNGYLPRIQDLYRQALGDQDPFQDPETGPDNRC